MTNDTDTSVLLGWVEGEDHEADWVEDLYRAKGAIYWLLCSR